MLFRSAGALQISQLDTSKNDPVRNNEDPCLGPNPPAYCFTGIRSAEPVEPEPDPIFYRYMNQGGRVGFKGGADMATVAGDTRPARKGSVNISPTGNVRFDPGGKDDKPVDKSTFEQDLMSRRASRGLETGSPTFKERAKGGLKSIADLIIAGIISPVGAAEMSDEEKAQLLEDVGIEGGAIRPPAETFPRFLADEYGTYKNIMGGPAATGAIVDEYKGTFPGLEGVPTKELEERFEKGLADPSLMQVSLPGQPRIMAAEGGIMDLEQARQGYKLGKLVKKATRAVKKIVKSPIGKAAILGGLTFGIPGVQSGFFSKGLMGTQKGLGLRKFLTDSIFGKVTDLGIAGSNRAARTGGLLNFLKDPLMAITGTSLLSGLLTKQQQDDEDEEIYRGPRLDMAAIESRPYDFVNPRLFAEGGSTEKEPVAKKTMPLLDMGGMEKDYRKDGGFVPIGRMEKADDVPARLSKNEFVFTADAVRNAGDGDVDKGAEVMYNMMKNLEAGGNVSEESQGLDGARKMFQTSQRLEEVL